MNNHHQGFSKSSYSDGEISPDSVDITFDSSVIMNILFETLGNDISMFTPPDRANRLGCNGNYIVHKTGATTSALFPFALWSFALVPFALSSHLLYMSFALYSICSMTKHVICSIYIKIWLVCLFVCIQ